MPHSASTRSNRIVSIFMGSSPSLVRYSSFIGVRLLYEQASDAQSLTSPAGRSTTYRQGSGQPLGWFAAPRVGCAARWGRRFPRAEPFWARLEGGRAHRLKSPVLGI